MEAKACSTTSSIESRLDTSPPEAARHSYRQILTSTGVIGGSTVISLLFGMVRTKLSAVLLGPSGVGLMGTYTSITNTVNNLANMGISDSGVRQIAEAVGTGNQARIAYTIKVVRRMVFALGVAGALLLYLVRVPFCRLTFGNSEYTAALAVLAATILITAISNGQMTLLQGMRRIADLAKLRVLGAVLGTVIGIPMIWAWGQRGIVPLLVTVSVTSSMTSWWYARKVRVPPVTMSWVETRDEVRSLLALGVVFMAGGLMSAMVAYAARVIIIRRLGIDAAGQYQAAWTLAGLYIGVILESMRTDYFPRLTAVAKDNVKCNRLVNEQTEVSLLLATPGILATLVFAPLVIQVFYSAKFGPAIELLRWQLLGLLLQVVSWPLGFIMVAKGAVKWYFWTEVASYSVHMFFIWVGVALWGLPGAGVAFLGLYVFHWMLMIMVTRRMTEFSYSAANRRLLLVSLPAVITIFLFALLLPSLWTIIVGSAATLTAGLYAIRELARLPGAPIGAILNRIKGFFNL